MRLNEKDKRVMVSTAVQIMVLLMTSSTCYKFGGHIYKQKGGLGIGLRGSAALARLAMCRWDVLWAQMTISAGINLKLLFRYVDDLRIGMSPLRKGW